MELANDPLFAYLKPAPVSADEWKGRPAAEYWNTESADLVTARIEEARKRLQERAS